MMEFGVTHRNSEGLEIFERAWLPDDAVDGKMRGVLLFVHGLAEHSGRYRHVAEYFTARGYACRAIDLRGHGRSAGRRVHVRDFEDYAHDVRLLRESAREHHGDLPQVLVGHSMGGLIVALEALRRPEGLRGAILSSPAFATHPSSKPPAILHALSHVVARLVPGMLFPSDLNADFTSRDPAVVEAYQSDPLVTRKVSARWYVAILDAMRSAFIEAPDLDLPVLVMQSGDDRLVDGEATRRWATITPDERVDLQVWPGLYHEMFNEPEREQVFARMESWLESSPTRSRVIQSSCAHGDQA